MTATAVELETPKCKVTPEVIGSAGVSGRPLQEDGLRFRAGRVVGEKDDGEQFVEQQPLTETERRWATYVAVASGLDLLASAAILVTAFKYAYRDSGVSLYSLGFQTSSHWISSLLILLRLIGELKSEHVLLIDHRRTQLGREQLLSISMALVMLISSVALLFKAIRKIKFWEHWYEAVHRHQYDHEVLEITEWLAWTGFAIYLAQAIIRVIAACKTGKQGGGLLSHGCVASIVSLLFLFVLGSAASYEREWSWKAEPIAAIALAFVTLFEGVRIIYNYIDDMDGRLRYDPHA